MKKAALVVILALVFCSVVAQVATAEQISMIVGRITVNGQPQESAIVSGFGSTASTGPDGQYVLKFESAGAGAINASYGGYHTSSGLIVVPSGPLIKLKDLNIVIPESASGTITGTGSGNMHNTPAETVWTHVPAPTATADAVHMTDRNQAFDISGAIVLFTIALCTALICFLIYLTVRK